MSWIERCYETYENCTAEVGNQKGVRVPLLPVAHTTQQVNIEVELDADGNFESARLLSKSEQTTIIPCTEESSARTSGPAAHPLVDKLQYIAADYERFGGKKEPRWPLYEKQLRAWCDSPYGNDKVRTVLRYLEKGCLIADLVKCHILFLDDDGTLPTKWKGSKEDKPKVLETLAGDDQTESFVRFRVDGDDLSRDIDVRESFIQYYEAAQKRVDYCTVQGCQMALSTLSPYKIRNPGDRAKLISGNDSTNFTYRGRFIDTTQALSVGYETTQKAHSALRWLIGRQGCNTGDQTVLVWGTKNEAVPRLTDDSMSLGAEFDALLGQMPAIPQPPSTEEAFAAQFNKAINGYGRILQDDTQTVVMILDSATPGRLSIRYYRELSGSRLLENVKNWHQTFCWRLEYRSIPDPDTGPGKKSKPKHVTFVGAPAPADIAKAAYGEKADTKIIQQTIERLIPCIAEGRFFPYDLMHSAVQRATAGIGMEPWEARKTSGIACALIRGYYHRNKKEDFSMGVDESIQDRNYLFGRILACAEQIERRAQSQSDEKRPTNAERLRVAFVQHPAKTTALLPEKLTPYLNRVRANGTARNSRYDLMLELLDRLGKELYNNKPLNELYLLGYASQTMDFRRENANFKENTETVE
ncbi:type I-C CRISPR-associated protein Cas8c/Csd1 [Gemmiger sp.]